MIQFTKYLIDATWIVYHAINLMLKCGFVFAGLGSPSPLMMATGIEYSRNTDTKITRSVSVLASIMYALRFVQWWQEQKVNQPLNTLPDAPIDFPKAKVREIDGRCAICLGIPRVPTAIPSGRVFCKDCITSHVRHTGKCPVTDILVSESDIRHMQW